jgi:SAM-dependent methyltransferase
MIRYVAAAAGLKLFSLSPRTREMYRALGNRVGARRRTTQGLPEYYLIRARWLMRSFGKHRILASGDRILEVGTGWLHWEAIVAKLSCDVRATLFDIWDNRQLEPLRRYYGELAKRIDAEVGLDPSRRERVHGLLEAISSVASFADLYGLLGFEYVVEPGGTLRRFQDASFNAILSGGVLHAVRRDILPGYVRDIGRLLKPGGYSLHTIDMADQISYYDPGVSIKEYLRFSEATWARVFENDVQYFNRLQRSEWLDLFGQAGLELVEEQTVTDAIIPQPVAGKYRELDRVDLACRVLRVVHRKR